MAREVKPGKIFRINIVKRLYIYKAVNGAYRNIFFLHRRRNSRDVVICLYATRQRLQNRTYLGCEIRPRVRAKLYTIDKSPNSWQVPLKTVLVPGYARNLSFAVFVKCQRCI